MAETNPRVADARREVLAARGALVDAVDRLETRARSAADLRAQVRQSPEKAAAVVAALAFLAVGGPKKVLKGAKRAVFGRGKPYPSRLLPDEIEGVLRKLGGDGDKVRGTLEREFAAYLKDKKRKEKGGALRSLIVGSLLMPAASAALKGAAKRAAAGEPIFPSGGGWGSSYGSGPASGEGSAAAGRGAGRDEAPKRGKGRKG